jgi:hypothetical protein
LASIPIGALASARLQLASVLGVVVVMLLVDGRAAPEKALEIEPGVALEAE